MARKSNHVTVEAVTEEAREFARRRNLPGVEVRYMQAGRTQDVVLSHMGRELATKTQISRRGKPDMVFYNLRHMPADLA